jgi:hypothetical protein
MRTISATVGPSLTSTANNIATSQSPVVGATVAATMTNSSASITATNAFVAGNQVQFLNQGGKLPINFTPLNNYFVIATGLTVAHFQVAATLAGTAITVSTGGTGTQNVVSTSTVALNGTLVNASGVAVLAHPQRILITTADSTTVFTVIGTDASGQLITETMTSNGTSVQSALDYTTVTSISFNQNPTAALTVGTNGVGSTPWIYLDEWADSGVAIQCDATGTVNYTLQSSLDNPNGSGGNEPLSQNVTWIATNDTAAVGATGNVQTNFLFAPRLVRVLLNSGSGSVTVRVIQANVVGR